MPSEIREDSTSQSVPPSHLSSETALVDTTTGEQTEVNERGPSIAAPNRKPVTTARERNCDNHPIRNTARARKNSPVVSVIPATRVATSVGSSLMA